MRFKRCGVCNFAVKFEDDEEIPMYCKCGARLGFQSSEWNEFIEEYKEVNKIAEPTERNTKYVFCNEDDKIQISIPCNGEELIIGRHCFCDEIYENISRVHIIVTLTAGSIIRMEDRSLNGTRLNGRIIEKLKPYQVKENDTVTLDVIKNSITLTLKKIGD